LIKSYLSSACPSCQERILYTACLRYKVISNTIFTMMLDVIRSFKRVSVKNEIDMLNYDSSLNHNFMWPSVCWHIFFASSTNYKCLNLFQSWCQHVHVCILYRSHDMVRQNLFIPRPWREMRGWGGVNSQDPSVEIQNVIFLCSVQTVDIIQGTFSRQYRQHLWLSSVL